MLNIRAHQNPSTLKPGTRFAARIITNALITKVNKPKVRMLIGSVRIRRMGLRTAFIIPKTTAATRAETKLVT